MLSLIQCSQHPNKAMCSAHDQNLIKRFRLVYNTTMFIPKDKVIDFGFEILRE